jgi:hypothetical protein
MNQISLIRKTLQPHLNWHGARVTFLAMFLVALMRVRTVNFSELAKGFMGTAQTESNQKRLHRFFRDFQLDLTLPSKNGHIQRVEKSRRMCS